MDIVDAKDKTTLFLQRVENVSTAGRPRLLSGGETAMDTTSAMLVVIYVKIIGIFMINSCGNS